MKSEEKTVQRTILLTEKEKKVIDMVVAEGTYKKAAERLGWKPSSLRAILFRVRMRYERAKTFVEMCEEYQRKLPRKKTYITGPLM